MENISSACATKLETKQEKQNCVVQTKEGPVRGYIEEIDDKIYYKFKSIPYAKPPLGDLRFLVSLLLLLLCYFVTNVRV